jgi:hypothetical protein
MFVRNNMICPHCGRSRTFDLSVNWTDAFDDALLIRAECFDCLAIFERPVSFATLRCAFWDVSQRLPRKDVRASARRVRPFGSSSWRDRVWVIRNADTFLGPNIVDWKSAVHPTLQILCESVVGSTGSTILRCWDRVLPPALGQPLAS